MEDRVTVIVPDKKEKINKIREKYNNPNLTNADALKIESLEATNKILKNASAIAGVLFVIDLIIPDPMIGIDEAALGFITAASKSASAIVENKIEAIANSEDATLKENEVKKLAKDIGLVASTIKSNRSSRSR